MGAATQTVRNGVDTAQLAGVLAELGDEPSLATFRFRARNRWVDGAHSRSTIRDFHGAGREDGSRDAEFVLDAGEPSILLGRDTGPSPAEHLLHALAASLTTSLVFAAAERGVRLIEVESTIEGELDVRGALGLSDGHGFERIDATFCVRGDAPRETLCELVALAQQRSAVFDMLVHGVPVTVDVETDCAVERRR
jgi:uncharacterized OsmC-like protein